MAALGHLGVALAVKPAAPDVNVWYLILGAYVLDFLWYGFVLVGMESPLNAGAAGHPPYWEHSLVMAVVWSVLFGLLASWIGRNRRIGIIFGLMVFSHWVIDFITHPMTAIMPPGTVDKGLPLAFGNSPFVGLGLYRTMAGVWLTEIGSVVIGAIIYTSWRLRMNRL